jgi:hypothetical protein
LFFADANTGFNRKERKARADEKLAASFTSLPSVKLASVEILELQPRVVRWTPRSKHLSEPLNILPELRVSVIGVNVTVMSHRF